MQLPNKTLTDLLNSPGRQVVTDPNTRQVIFDPAKAVGAEFLFVPPDGKVIVLRVSSCSVSKGPDGSIGYCVSGRMVAHTTVNGVLAESSNVILDAAPPPVKPKRIIEEA